MQKIRNIKLGGQVYKIEDETALRLDENRNLSVPTMTMTDTPEVANDAAISNVLVQGADGRLMKRSTEQLLEDIGGFSCGINGNVFVVESGFNSSIGGDTPVDDNTLVGTWVFNDVIDMPKEQMFHINFTCSGSEKTFILMYLDYYEEWHLEYYPTMNESDIVDAWVEDDGIPLCRSYDG